MHDDKVKKYKIIENDTSSLQQCQKPVQGLCGLAVP